jgi:hypothetical protein
VGEPLKRSVGRFSHHSVVMHIVTQVFASICCLLLVVSAASAKSWRGIEPLHSTRADVERLLGPSNVDRDLYDFPGERTSIWYSAGGCSAGLPGGWNVPKDTVVSIYSSLTEWKKLEDVLVPGRDYQQIRAAHTQHVYYVDTDEGVRYTVWEGMVQSINYLPAARDENLSCGEYKYAAPVPNGVKLNRMEQVTFDSFGDISFEDAKARLDNFVIQLFQLKEKDPHWRGYIVVYAGRRSYRGEAQYKANCAKRYLVGVRRMDDASLFATDGGFREEPQVELYLGRSDYYPPVLDPTVSPKAVKIINRPLRSCKDRSSSNSAANKRLERTRR